MLKLHKQNCILVSVRGFYNQIVDSNITINHKLSNKQPHNYWGKN